MRRPLYPASGHYLRSLAFTGIQRTQGLEILLSSLPSGPWQSEPPSFVVVSLLESRRNDRQAPASRSARDVSPVSPTRPVPFLFLSLSPFSDDRPRACRVVPARQPVPTAPPAAHAQPARTCPHVPPLVAECQAQLEKKPPPLFCRRDIRPPAVVAFAEYSFNLTMLLPMLLRQPPTSAGSLPLP